MITHTGSSALPDALGTGTEYVLTCTGDDRGHFPRSEGLLADWCHFCGQRIFHHAPTHRWYNATWHMIIEEP